MDPYPDAQQHESSAKRIKLDLRSSNSGELCSGDGLSGFPASASTSNDISEGLTTDCDSGCGTSFLETTSTPSHQTSPHTDSLDTLSEIYSQTATYTDNLDTSQDSIENDDYDDNASTISHLSDLSGLSELSGQDWKPIAGSMIWIQKQMQSGINPRILLSELGVDSEEIPQYIEDVTLWKIIINMLAEPPRRNKLRHVNSLDDVVRLMKGAQNIIVLTGAGVSVSCGIPDFRSKDGIYSRLAIDFPDLPDPQAMFDISYFSQDPRPFFKFARDIYPGKFLPSPCHRFIKLLEKHRKLLRNYTQNIDTLEKIASIQKVIECHGSFATATCTKCNHKVTAGAIRDIVLAQKIPLCEKCHAGKPASDLQNGEGNDYREIVASGIMKPDIVFFGEGLPKTFHEAMADDKSKCDLLLVIGSSLKVRPVALIPSSLPPNVPQILINREPLPQYHFDVELLGDCDIIINHLCHLLGNAWDEGVYNKDKLHQVAHLLSLEESHIDCFSENNEVEISGNSIKIVSNETEPNCTMYDKLDKRKAKCTCNCKSIQSSSFQSENVGESTNCSCYKNYTHQMSIIKKQTTLENQSDDCGKLKVIKERHMSIDSARDSGIGENSNFTDLETKYDDTSDENSDDNVATNEFTEKKLNKYSESCSSSLESQNRNNFDITGSSSDLRGFWQPKIKKSLADRLPPNAFHLIPPSRYIFPGAEVYYDPDEKFEYQNESSSSGSSDCETDNDAQTN